MDTLMFNLQIIVINYFPIKKYKIKICGVI